MEDLAALVAANEDAAAAIAAAYEILLGGVPNVAGFDFLINNAIDTNYGSNNPNVVFNQENIFINIVNSLVQGNSAAATAFASLTAGQSTLIDKITALYNELIPNGTAEGIAYLTRPDALAFFQQVAAERGVAGPDGAAIVALASILNEAVKADLPGIGDSVNDLLAAIANGSAALPETGNTLTPIEVADGEDFDGDDGFGKTITLTDRIDAPGIDDTQPGSGRNTMGTASDDKYIASDATLNPGDVIDGGAGRDQLVLNLVDSKFGVLDANINPATLPLTGIVINLPLYEVESTGLEEVVIQLRGGQDIIDDLINPPVPSPFDPNPDWISGAEVDLSRSTDIDSVVVERSAGVVRVDNIQNNVELTLNNAVGLFQFIFDANALGGDAAIEANLTDVLGLLQLEANGGDEITELTLNTEGGNIVMISDNFDQTVNLTSLTVTGGGTNILVSDLLQTLAPAPLDIPNEFASLTDIDFSGNTGGTAIELLFNEEDVTFVGGSGADIVIFDSSAGGGFVTDADSLDGGAGYDVLGLGGDDLAALSPATVQNFELFALFNDASGNDFEFEGSDFDAEVALFADWNATLRFDDYEGREVFVFGNLANTTLQWDDTDTAAITVGIPPELAAYVDLIMDSIDLLGADPLADILNTFPIAATVDVVDLTGQDTPSELELVVAPVGGLLPFPDSQLTIGEVVVDATSALELVTISGTGSVDLGDFLDAPGGVHTFIDGLTFDLTGLTGGFDNNAGQEGAQTFLLGAIGTALDGLLPPVGPNIDPSVLWLGPTALDGLDVNGVPDPLVGAQDVVEFTQNFGTVEIQGFGTWAAVTQAQGQQDLLDFTALGVTRVSDLTIVDTGADVEITSSLFDGTVVLVGVGSVNDLALENFAGLTA